MSDTTTRPRVTGRCMACGAWRSLFVADGGYITCSRSDCPDPGAVADWLERPTYHTLLVGPDGWSMQHPVTCFPDLTACDLHARVAAWFVHTPPAKWHGLYRIRADDGTTLALDPIDQEDTDE